MSGTQAAVHVVEDGAKGTGKGQKKNKKADAQVLIQNAKSELQRRLSAFWNMGTDESIDELTKGGDN